MDPGQAQNGTARADFEEAWRTILPTLTETSFQDWCYQHDFTAWKYAMLETGKKPSTQLPVDRPRCYCSHGSQTKGRRFNDSHFTETYRTAFMGRRT
jgi:hypothetical protein